MLTHFDLVQKAQRILQEYLAAPYQNDKKTLELLVALFDGPEQREADREAQIDRYSATFTRQLAVPTIQRIIHHLHVYKHRLLTDEMPFFEQQEGKSCAETSNEIDNILKLLVAKLTKETAPHIPENPDGGSLSLIPVRLLMHVLMVLEDVKAKHPVDEGKLLQILGDLKEVRPLPKSFVSIKPTIEKAAEEIISSQEEVPSTGLSSVEWLSPDNLTKILTRHFGNLFHQQSEVARTQTPELNAALASMDSFLREQFGPSTSPYFLARSYLDDIQRARAPRVDMGSAPNIPGAQGQPVKHPTDFFPSMPFAEGSFHYEAIELLRAVLNSVVFPTAISKHAKWHNVFDVLTEEQKLNIKELLIRGLRERGSLNPPMGIDHSYFTKIVDEVTIQFQTHDGSTASPREVLLNIGGRHFTARETCNAILRLLADQRDLERGYRDSGKADQGSKDQGNGDKRSMMERTVDDVQTQMVDKPKDNSGAPPNRFLHIIPGMHVVSPVDARKEGNPIVKVMVEQVNSMGIIVVHPIQGRRGFQWHLMTEEQKKAVSTVIPE